MKIPYLDPQWLLDDPNVFTENDRIRVVLDSDQHVTLMLDQDRRRASASPARLVVDRRNTDQVILENIYDSIQLRQLVGPHIDGPLAFIDRWLRKCLASSDDEIAKSAIMEYVVDDGYGSPTYPLVVGQELRLRACMPGDFTPVVWVSRAVIDSIEYYTL